MGDFVVGDGVGDVVDIVYWNFGDNFFVVFDCWFVEIEEYGEVEGFVEVVIL